MTLEEKILKVGELNHRANELALEKEKIDEELNLIQAEKDILSQEILTEMLKRDIKEQKAGEDTFATVFHKENVEWLNDEGLLNKLKEENNEYVKTTVKTTVSIDKNGLKKAFNTNPELKEKYKEFYGTKVSEYVVVNSGDVHQRMLEHLDSALSNKISGK